VNDSVPKSKFGQPVGCRGIAGRTAFKRATDVMMPARWRACAGTAGRGSKGSAQALRALRRAGRVTEIDPIKWRCRRRWERLQAHDGILGRQGLHSCFTTPGHKGIIRNEHMAAMKDQEIVCQLGHSDNEIDSRRSRRSRGTRSAAGRSRDSSPR